MADNGGPVRVILNWVLIVLVKKNGQSFVDEA